MKKTEQEQLNCENKEIHKVIASAAKIAGIRSNVNLLERLFKDEPENKSIKALLDYAKADLKKAIEEII